MDFTNRNVQQPSSARSASEGSSASGGGGHKSKDAGWRTSPKWLKIAWVVMLFSGVVLVLAIVALLLFNDSKQESEYVEKDKFQAVFLDNGQVYFGKINSVNDTVMDLQSIYYLSVDQPVQPEQEGAQQQGNITLVKLGCELHGPDDQMIINRDKITFWENLKSDRQVSKAIAQWLEQNPEGQKCAEPSQNQSNSGSEEATGSEESNGEEQ